MPDPSVPPPAVVVLADDPLTRDGTHAFMASRARVEVLPRDRLPEADVVVLITEQVTGESLAALREARLATGGRVRGVLVADRMSGPHRACAARYGTVACLPRQHTSFARIEAAALAVHRGEPVEPAARCVQPHAAPPAPAPEPRADRSGTGAAPGGLAPREVDVLRLLAEGRGVMEIAAELRYSERLIKSVIHSVVQRLGLRNRTQAVAHAIRAGLL